MIYLKIPIDFSPKFEVVSCFCEFDGRFILLKRQAHKSEGNKWGMPAGKINVGETLENAMKRELQEETGIDVNLQNLKHQYKVFIRYPEYDFIYHIFSTKWDSQKEIVISPKEHTDKIWVSPEDALQLDLVKDLDACIKLMYFEI